MQLNITEAGGEHEESFFFEAVPNKFMQSKQTKQILTKWGLLDTLRIGSFRFNQSFNQFQLQGFLRDLFSNPNVRYIINNIKYPTESASSIEFQKLNCNELSTQMFEKLNENNIVSQEYICKTFADPFQGIQICDKLRECLLVEESESYCVFGDKDRKEFLFRLFQLLVVGGSLNQYEDNITPYLEWTKNLYKSVVSVRKQAESGNIFIDSTAIQIKKIEKGIFAKQYNPQTVLYVTVSPSTRTVHVISNHWVKFW